MRGRREVSAPSRRKTETGEQRRWANISFASTMARGANISRAQRGRAGGERRRPQSPLRNASTAAVYQQQGRAGAVNDISDFDATRCFDVLHGTFSLPGFRADDGPGPRTGQDGERIYIQPPARHRGGISRRARDRRDAGDQAARGVLEFFAATIRNKNTRMAYYLPPVFRLVRPSQDRHAHRYRAAARRGLYRDDATGFKKPSVKQPLAGAHRRGLRAPA